MASLINKTPAETYKDLLTVASSTPNQGLESSIKQIFDGDGIGSPVWLSTNLLQVGTTVDNANLNVNGNINAKKFKLISSNNTLYDAMQVTDNGVVQMLGDFETKGTVTFKAVSGDDLVLDAEGNAFEMGDGSKGRVSLYDNSVKLQKGSTDLLEVREDGTVTFNNINTYPSSSNVGDIVLHNGQLEIYQ